MRSKQSVEIRGRRTSLSLEAEYWTALGEIASSHNITVQELIEQIVQGYEPDNLSSIVRLFVLKHYQDATQPR
jgi:predicted DNA-binding ribbon-helix-helix protein